MRTTAKLITMLLALSATPLAAEAPIPANITAIPAGETAILIRLGYSAERVLDLVGWPDDITQYETYQVWNYYDRDMFLMVNATQGVVGIFFTARDGGEIEDLRVGDSFDEAMDELGLPTSWDGDIAIFAGLETNVLVQESRGRITLIGIALAFMDE
jgi:hypothetical protein